MLLLATDFDGTVAPIAHDAKVVSLDRRILTLFQQHDQRSDVALAFISGRDLDDLREKTAGVRAWRSGSHGLEVETPDGELIVSREPVRAVLEASLEQRLRSAGVRIEPKRFGMAIHWRGVEGVSREHALVEEFRSWAERNGFALTDGRAVLEARVSGPSKLDVLRVLVERVSATRVVYAGDDLTDIRALAYAAKRGQGFFVRSKERPESLPDAVIELASLDELLDRFTRLL